MSTLHIAFFGTPELTVPVLEHLKASGFSPKVIVTNPDRPKGRDMAVTPSPAKVWAKKHKIPVLTPEKLDDVFIKELSSYDINLGLVVAYGSILPLSVIDAPRFGMINVHYSLLPKYRGATPVESAILNGEEKTGVTIQRIVPKLDAGQIILQKELDILPDETAPELRDRLNEMAKQMVVDTLIAREKGSAREFPQDDSKATNCKKTKKEHGELNLKDKGDVNYRKYRAYFGWPGTYFFKDKKRIKITKAKLVNGEFVIEKVIPEGKKEIAYGNFK